MIDIFHSYHVLVFQNDRVLLVKHGKNASHFSGVYGIPGGRSNLRESERQAATRELAEETGIKVKIYDLKIFPKNTYTAFIKRKKGPSGNFTMKVFATNLFMGELKTNDEAEPVWVKISELDNYNLLPNVKKAILIAQKSITRP